MSTTGEMVVTIGEDDQSMSSEPSPGPVLLES